MLLAGALAKRGKRCACSRTRDFEAHANQANDATYDATYAVT